MMKYLIILTIFVCCESFGDENIMKTTDIKNQNNLIGSNVGSATGFVRIRQEVSFYGDCVIGSIWTGSGYLIQTFLCGTDGNLKCEKILSRTVLEDDIDAEKKLQMDWARDILEVLDKHN